MVKSSSSHLKYLYYYVATHPQNTQELVLEWILAIIANKLKEISLQQKIYSGVVDRLIVEH